MDGAGQEQVAEAAPAPHSADRVRKTRLSQVLVCSMPSGGVDPGLGALVRLEGLGVETVDGAANAL